MNIELPEFFNNVYYDNRVADYLASLLILVAVYATMKLIKWVVIKKVSKFTKKTNFRLDDLIVSIIRSFKWPAFFIISLKISSLFLNIPQNVENIINNTALIVLSFYVVKAAQQITEYVASVIKNQIHENDASADVSIINVIRKILNMVFWLIAVIIILENFGFDLSTLVAGVGVSSIAIAFALQSVLEDLFASVSIYFDRPFNPGDFIIVGDQKGTVKSIGIQTTRLRALGGEEIVISNKELTTAQIQNFKRLEERRIESQFGVIYETPLKKLKAIPEMVEKIIENVENARFGRAHFVNLGDFSLDFEIVYFIETSSYSKYLDARESINLQLMEKFEKEGIEFAYPTRVVINKK